LAMVPSRSNRFTASNSASACSSTTIERNNSHRAQWLERVAFRPGEWRVHIWIDFPAS
jgi:hypothetical protein